MANICAGFPGCYSRDYWVRIYATLWVIVISLFYFGVKGGLFTLATGGNFHVNGPDGTLISDNNVLAVALLMSLPLANFLRSQVSNNLLRGGVSVGIGLTVIAIVGTYSRGALIGLLALGAVMLLRARRRLAYLGAVGVIAMFVAMFMPPQFFDRMQTIDNAEQDTSFAGRVIAWKVATDYAVDHFPFGAGFYGPQQPRVFLRYFPRAKPRAAHSIYFQVLGEHGFVGLLLYLSLLLSGFVSCARAIRLASADGQLWIRELAIAVQASLVVFCVSGAALSMAYYDLFIIEIMLLLPLGRLAGYGKKRSPLHAGQLQTVPI